jgi:hypothetical protein
MAKRGAGPHHREALVADLREFRSETLEEWIDAAGAPRPG